MAKYGLTPAVTIEEVQRSLQRINNVNDVLLDVDEGFADNVIGSRIVTTKLAVVHRVIAGFDDGPIAGSCFLQAFLQVAPTSDIKIWVYDNAFAASILATDVNWIAVGERAL